MLARYPKDPRAHLIRALFFVDTHSLYEAERKLRVTMTLAAPDAGGQSIRNHAQGMLAIVLAVQGRHGEARTLAAAACRDNGQVEIRRALDKMKMYE